MRHTIATLAVLVSGLAATSANASHHSTDLRATKAHHHRTLTERVYERRHWKGGYRRVTILRWR